MYFVLEGGVEIIYEDAGRTRRVAFMGPQEFFGEMALITGDRRTATAVSSTRTRVLPVGRDEFLAQMKSKPQLALFVIQVLVSRLRAAMRPAQR